MKLKFYFLSIVCFLAQTASSQYFQQRADFEIEVQLNEKEKSIDAFEKITYTNNSPDTLHFIWFHVWPNAYRNDKTAFSDQQLENGNTKFYFSSKEEKGYINRLDFKVDGVTARMEDHPSHIDIIKLVLPKPLLPKEKITITTPFHVKLPFHFSRGGYFKETFQLTQWYPKPAVYDQEGWHPMPYLDQGEFYSEFGSYDVRIKVPVQYVVAATGELQNEDEKEFLKSRTAIVIPPKIVGDADSIPSPVAYKVLHYKQDNVHDFAWFADKDFIVNYDTLQLSSGRIIDVYGYYHPKDSAWKNIVQYAKDAVRFYSGEVGEYRYNVVSVVSGPQGVGGGMEYPTITLISPMGSAMMLDIVTAHEIGHNWFYGILASNERRYPWMDEGMNSYYEKKYTKIKYGEQPAFERMFLDTRIKRKTDQPISTRSEEFSMVNYGMVAYMKTAEWMKYLESKMGSEAFRSMMQDYYNQWKFRHPGPDDFKLIAQQRLGAETDEVFSLLDKKGSLPGETSGGLNFVSIFKKNSIKSYLADPKRHILFLSPAMGANAYDKFMLGVLLTNYKLPPDNFQFFLAPMYGFGSKKFTGLGKLNYSFHSDGSIRKTDLFLNGSSFSMNDFSDTSGNKYVMQFRKIVPGFRMTFREKNARSNVIKSIQWKTFLINEEGLRSRRDSIFNGPDTSVVLRFSTVEQSRYLNQLKFSYENYRALYPYDIALQIEQNEDLLRPTLTAGYFFNYPKKGGLQLRFFTGKIIYLGEKTLSKRFSNDRFHLNMTGPNGYEDYTYSDYFAGRNEFEGWKSQQIMMRDGAFKVRTDLLASKVGKTDDWLMSLNLNSIVPDQVNPLSVLPVKIPLHVFLDIGTYAEVWQRNATDDRFLFDAGFHIPLFQGMINVYIPVLYNKVYSDYFKSTILKNRFLKTISFSVDLYNSSIRKLNKEVEF